MNYTNIEFSINKADTAELIRHLIECDTVFIPQLSSYVNINEYCNKIRKNAITFESWENEKLIGMIACYMNNTVEKNAFITNVSVLENYQNKKIAKYLMSKLIEQAEKLDFISIELEVFEQNTKAINFYLRI